MQTMVQTFLTYSEVFEDENFDEWETLAELGPEGYMRIYGACFNLDKVASEHYANDPTNPQSWHEIRNFFSPDNISAANEVLKSLKSPLLGVHKVFSNYVVLSLLERYKRPAQKEREIGPEDELRMLKAVLSLNQDVVNRQAQSNAWMEPGMIFANPHQGLWRSFYAMMWPFFEVNHLNVVEQIALETIKCSLLVNWLSTKHINCLIEIERKQGFKVNEGFLSASKIAFDFAVVKNQLFEIFINPIGIAGQVLENISSVDFMAEKNKDFTYFRANPVFKIDSNRYAVRFMPFIVPAFGTGLYFKARDVYSEINPKYDFRGQFTKDFNEGYLVKTVLDWCFASKYQVTNIDEFLDESDKKADFIVSNHKSSFVIEVKDNLIADNISGSMTAEEIEQKIDALFCRNEKESQGLIQLASTLKRLPTGSRNKKRRRFDKHDFFPILLVSSSKLKCSGVNLQVNAAWEERFLPGMTPDLVKRVHPVTVIHTDSLIYYADYFHSGQVKLQELLLDYHKSRLRFGLTKAKYQTKESVERDIFRCADSFYKFLNEEMRNRGFKAITKYFLKLGKELGKDLWEKENES